MEQFLQIIFSVPTILFTVLLVATLLFWLISMTGVIDHGADAHVDGELDGAFEWGGVLSVLGVQGVPFSFLLSFLFLFAWIISFSAQSLIGTQLSGWLFWLFAFSSLLLSPLLGLLLAALTLRPLVPLFTKQHAKATQASVLGQVGTIISGQVDMAQGRAEMIINGAHLIFQVRSHTPLTRGQQVMFTDYSPEQHIYQVIAV